MKNGILISSENGTHIVSLKYIYIILDIIILISFTAFTQTNTLLRFSLDQARDVQLIYFARIQVVPGSGPLFKKEKRQNTHP